MALSLSSLGLPGQILNLLGASSGKRTSKSATPSSKTANASGAASFGGALSGALTSATTATTVDPLAQLAALVKKGTPVSSFVDTLANQIADSVQRQPSGSQLASGASRTTLVDSIKTALSPPSNAPPESAADQVAALDQRLQRWLEGLSGGADQQTGQQSDISGSVLDADSARELPAHTQGSKSTPASTGSVSLAASLLQSVAAALSSGASAISTTSTKVPKGSVPSAKTADASPVRTAIAATAASDAGTAASSSAGLTATAPASQGATAPSTPAPAAAPAAASSAATVAATPAQTPGDLVARMVIRAAGVDAQHNATLPTVAAAAPSAQSARGTTSGTTQSSATTVEKMTTLLTQAIAAAAEASADGETSGDGTASGQGPDSGSVALPAKTVSSGDLSSFALPASSQPVTAAQTPTDSATSAPATVDPTAAIEQLVKSMAMRTGSDGTSEMRLHLQPASLGSVTLKLTVDGNNVSASVVAQNGEARTALLAGQEHLSRSLADSGLKLTSFTVDLSGGQTHDQARDNTSGFGRRYTVHETAAADTDSTETSDSSSAGPSLVSGSTLGLLSYLA